MASAPAGNPYYALEKLFAAVEALVVGEGDVRSRLQTAFVCFVAVKPRDFPSPLDKEFASIVSALTKHPARYPQEGSVQHTLSRVRNSTGSKIAARIHSLAYQLDAALKDQEKGG